MVTGVVDKTHGTDITAINITCIVNGRHIIKSFRFVYFKIT